MADDATQSENISSGPAHHAMATCAGEIREMPIYEMPCRSKRRFWREACSFAQPSPTPRIIADADAITNTAALLMPISRRGLENALHCSSGAAAIVEHWRGARQADKARPPERFRAIAHTGRARRHGRRWHRCLHQEPRHAPASAKAGIDNK